MFIFRWIKNLFTRRKRSNWEGFDAVDQARVDNENWRRENNDRV